MYSSIQLIEHIKQSFEKAENKKSQINNDIINMEGMTGIYTRHFYNNLLSIDNINYLEVGTWKGSSVCSAMFNNKSNVVAIDNFKQHNGPKTEFYKNFNKYKGNNDALFIENDYKNVIFDKNKKFNIYLYDGDHSYEST